MLSFSIGVPGRWVAGFSDTFRPRYRAALRKDRVIKSHLPSCSVLELMALMLEAY